ncbi:hypothetical protein CFC21_100863 [Triticum aestivum]|uniref:Disease resistance N-terminal domain-containing protein n=1 Tax=Triticum aestivum TaxID=4565 RepID=A0A9R1N3E5_WHEAT|nr:hypothetical protein CFC21_100863 [Triticum aestivum]
MAEAIVGLLIVKLGAALANEAATFDTSLLCSEASALNGLLGQISEAKYELESMQAYLKGAERFKDADDRTGLFVERIRGFAFEIEDVVDEFTYKLEEKHGGFVAKMKKRIKHVKTWRRLAHTFKDINGRLQGAIQRKEHYAMPEIGRNDGHRAHRVFNFSRDEDHVGIFEHKQQLMQWLTDLLKRIAREFGMPIDAPKMEIRILAETIYEYLQVHLEPLDKSNSWELFYKSAFWNDPDRKCPLEL